MEPVSLVLGFALGYLARGPLNAARVRAQVRREIREVADDLSSTANTSLDENEPEIQGVGGSMHRPFLQINDPRYAQVASYLRSIGVPYRQGPEYLLVSRVITPLQSEVLYRTALRSGLNFYRDDTDDIVIAPQGMMDIQSPIGVGAIDELGRVRKSWVQGRRKANRVEQYGIPEGAYRSMPYDVTAPSEWDGEDYGDNYEVVPAQHHFKQGAEVGRRKRARVDALAGLPGFYTDGNMGASGQTHWAGPLALTRIDVAARGRIPGRVDWFGLGG